MCSNGGSLLYISCLELVLPYRAPPQLRLYPSTAGREGKVAMKGRRDGTREDEGGYRDEEGEYRD